MAGLGAKLFTAFSKLTAAQVNGYLMDQSIMRFASAAVRDAAFGGVGEPTLAEGMTCYLDDTNEIQSYNGSAWVGVAASSNVANVSSGLVYVAQATVAAGSTILSLDSCFNSTYTNYVIVYNISSYSGSSILYMRLRSGGADDSAASYAWGRTYSRWDGASTSALGNMTDTYFPVGTTGSGVTTIENTINIYNPNVAERTFVQLQYTEIGTTTANSFNQLVAGQKQTLTQYTGLSLIRSGVATFGGTVTVYGYRK